jgi:hypothetical protein
MLERFKNLQLVFFCDSRPAAFNRDNPPDCALFFLSHFFSSGGVLLDAEQFYRYCDGFSITNSVFLECWMSFDAPFKVP